MTRKHFEALAAAFKEAHQTMKDDEQYQGQGGGCEALWFAEQMVAGVCASFNPNFNRARFLKACGVEEGK